MTIPYCLPFIAIVCLVAVPSRAREEVEPTRSIRVFVALCDNKTQGIIPVGERIGNGDDPDNNLYWGCSDGFGSYFKKSKHWKIEKSEKDLSHRILRRLTLSHKESNLTLVAEAYRGSEIRSAYLAFEAAVASDENDLVAFIGHNVLMDMVLPDPEPVEKNETEAIVLACVSHNYVSPRLGILSSEPVLMTSQLMYPGAFILHDAIETWRLGGSKSEIRNAAGKAYAKNQKISTRAATGIFSDLDPE